LARNIYYNITVEKITLVNFILDRERKSERHLQELILQSEVCFALLGSISYDSVQAMHRAADEIKTHSEQYKITTDHLAAQLYNELNGVCPLQISRLP